jgi:hypothetical protein
LIVPPLTVIEEPAMPESGSSDWVVHKVLSFYHIVGLSYEGFEDELMNFFTAIEPHLILAKRPRKVLLPLNQVDTRMIQLVLVALYLSHQTKGIVN